MAAPEPSDREWWREAVVYQIYPRSFADSDGDGIGDLRGIVDRVDYIDALGADAVWLCPVYESPWADNGYDVSDYRSIAPEYGTMDDWETLLATLHDRDIRLLMDLVVNHTSDEHEWFRKSRRRVDGYEDFYHWHDGRLDADGEPAPPNNWRSFMGGPAWSYDEARGQWYLHLFDEKQPDLNWRTPAVRDEVADVVTWWLEKGIDGFRLDAINYLSKPEGLPDGDPDRHPVGIDRFSHGPRIHEYLGELHDRTFSQYDAVTVAEMADTRVEQAREYVADGLDVIYHFAHMAVDVGPGGRWDHEEWGEWELAEFRRITSRWQTALDGGGWGALYLGNHDQPRIVSRFGADGRYREESATLLATFLLTGRGTPFVYAGEEIGMTNAEFGGLAALDDPMTVGAVEGLLERGAIDAYEDVRDFVNYMSRDHSRTPMQWSDADGAGFTDGEPWLPVNGNYREINVAAARADPDSVWHRYRRLIALRQSEDVLAYGDFELRCPDDEQVYAYVRSLDSEAVLVVLNWSGEPATVADGVVDPGAAGDADPTPSDLLESNYPDTTADPAGATFRPYEAAVYRL